MRVLILGGGGTLGAFSAGALRSLEAAGWRADACIASSAGGINLLRSMVGGPNEAAKFWSALDWKWIVSDFFRHNPINGGVLDPKRFRFDFALRSDESELLCGQRELLAVTFSIEREFYCSPFQFGVR